MQPGDIVTIFKDPFTRNEPEGEAVLRELVTDRRDEQVWFVEFMDELGTPYQRTIVV